MKLTPFILLVASISLASCKKDNNTAPPVVVPPAAYQAWEALYCMECGESSPYGVRTFMDTLRVKQFHDDSLNVYGTIYFRSAPTAPLFLNYTGMGTKTIRASRTSDSIYTQFNWSNGMYSGGSSCKGKKATGLLDVTDTNNDIQIAFPDSIFFDSLTTYTNNSTGNFEYFVWEFPYSPMHTEYFDPSTTQGNSSFQKIVRASHVHPFPPAGLSDVSFTFYVRAYKNGNYKRRAFTARAFAR